MTLHTASISSRIRSVAWFASAFLATLPLANAALAAEGTVNVTVTSSGSAIGVGYRWLLEEDSTYLADPDAPDATTTTNTLALNFHKSHMTVVAQGHSDSNPAAIPVPDTAKRYFLSILPDQHSGGGDPLAGPSLDCNAPGACFTQSGRQVNPELFGGGTTADLTVAVASQPVPTAQIFARAFQDSAPINGVWDAGEAPLGGWTVFIYDMGGQMMADTFGNPLGTVYNADGSVARPGDGTLHTMTEEEAADPARNPYGLAVGEVLVKGIAPGKYGMQMVPPAGQEWQQTSTIEGTRGIDAWVKANEPRFFAEFGPAGHHVEIGFVTTNPDLNDFPKPGQPGYAFSGPGSNAISGRIVNMRMARPPQVEFTAGHPLPGCWVGLNNATGTRGLAAAPCDEDSNFSFANVADGSYQLVIWDKYLDNIIATQAVAVAAGTGGVLGDVPVFRWFGAHEHYVFMDANDNGLRDPGEAGIPDQTVNLRFRDGSIYNSSTTDTDGYLPFDELFPFFSWLVAEVDFARFKATGVTVTVDAGGQVVDNAWGRGAYDDGPARLNPQTQSAAECRPGSENGAGLCQARTEVANTDPDNFVGPPLLEGYNSFLGTTQVFEWGKRAWNPGENGGISGVVYYQTTRAENDPRFAAPETWEPGIPRVQVALYHADARGRLYHNGPGNVRGALASAGSPIVLADVDNHPLGNFPLADGSISPEDIDRNGNGLFDNGDAIEVAHSDSWDDLLPEGCRPHQDSTGAPVADPFYLDGKCYDALRNYSQVRPSVFDGGYAFGKPFTTTYIAPGYYVVQASPPKGPYGEVYEIQQEEDKNVDFGDAMAVSPQALPPYCVGGVATDGTPLDQGVAPHDAGRFLDLFSTTDGPIEMDARFQGTRPGCDFRLVQVTDGKNAAADFFMFTKTPITGHIQGFVLNDVANEFDPNSPNFGEKMAPSFIPVSVRDYEGNEVYHTYTDRWGTYNAIVPSAYRINTPMPSGVSPNMLQVCLNAPTRQDAAGNWVPEPHQNRQFTQFCYTLDFKPGQTTYLDTPVLPIAAFVGPSNWQLDCAYPSGTPVINYVSAAGNAGPYVSATNRSLTIYSMGNVEVPDPLADRVDSTIGGSTNRQLVTRDFGFLADGESQGRIWIGGTEIAGADIVSWSNEAIVVNVPAAARTGQLRIRRGNGFETVHGLTITVDQAGGPVTPVRTVNAGESIQAAIDAANAGDLVLVAPGTYLEMLVMTKPIRLQGWGASATIVNPVQSPTEKLALWRDKLNQLANCTHEIGLLPGQPNNVAGSGPCGFTPGTGLFANEEGAGVLVAPAPGVFGSAEARIDGMTVSGADQAGGILVNGYATGLEISNNILANNQGPFAAGIRVGQPMLLTENAAGVAVPVDAQNDGLRIHHNHVAENGGLFEAGAGIGVYTGTDDYLIGRNYVCGNYAGGNGAGIAHYGLSLRGRILDNQVLFNQAFDQTVANSGNGGGILVAGYAPPAGAGTPGVGSVEIARNLIQGNNAGSGEGGGIATQFVASGTGTSKLVQIVNNIIVNNVAGLAGGGIAMDDATRVSILNNTIVNNDSTGTAALAFADFGACVATPNEVSCPHVAGVISHGGSIGANGFRNNVILGNRAMHVELDASGAVTVHGQTEFSDVGGVGLFDGGIAGTNGLRNSLLGNTNLLAATTDYCSSTASGARVAPRGNSCLDPLAVEPTHFVYPYWNSPPPFGTGGTYVPPEGGTLANLQMVPTIAVAADEGGNFIDIHYGPLSRVYAEDTTGTVVTETLSDYHLVASAVDAIDATACTGPGSGCSGNGLAPLIDVDGQQRKVTGNAIADRGADEYWAGYSAGTTPLNNLANLPPEIGNPGLQRALATVPFALQILATDPNGDALTFRLTSTYAGLGVDPATGIISWTPIWPVAPACGSGPGGTVDCSVTVQASDNGFGTDGLTCTTTGAAANCASRTFTVRVRNYLGGPTANNNNYSVTTMGTFAVPPAGVLGNDSSPNNGGPGGNFARLTAQLIADNTTANGQLTLAADGSFTFIPNANWVGSTNFTYRAFDGLNSSATATVALNRQIAATTARYIGGTWTFEGRGSIDLRRIHIVRVRGNVPLTPTVVTARPQVVSGSWSFSLAGGPNFQVGDTVNITSTTNAGGGAFTLLAVPVLAGAANDILSTAHVQCPLDLNGDGVISGAAEAAAQAANPQVVCKHLGAGDGWIVMADDARTELYTFGFNDLTAVPENQAIGKGILNAQFPAPTLAFNQDDEVYLTLTNVGMLLRPDLFDPHSVHFHGFPNAAAVFDGVPEASIAINMGFSFTYYYNTLDPGTYMYHCHVEAAEHMQMGMLGNLYVRPKQNGTTILGRSQFVYNDGDGSTGYDVEFPIQIGSMDRNFHEQHIGVQPLPFAEMHDDYPMLNGRGYPDTMDAGNLPVAPSKSDPALAIVSGSETSQTMNTRIVINKGQKALLRISNLNVTRFYTLATTGLPMQVIGTGAHILRGPAGGAASNLYYTTSSVTLGGGESADVLIDTSDASVQPGRYLLYSTNLEALSNGAEDFGGMMTEIVVNPAP